MRRIRLVVNHVCGVGRLYSELAEFNRHLRFTVAISAIDQLLPLLQRLGFTVRLRWSSAGSNGQVLHSRLRDVLQLIKHRVANEIGQSGYEF